MLEKTSHNLCLMMLSSDYDSSGEECGEDTKQVQATELMIEMDNVNSSRVTIFKNVSMYLLFLTSIFIESIGAVIATHMVPQRSRFPPLPDIFLDNVPYTPWCARASEILIAVLVASNLLMVILHKQRSIIWRRVCLITSMLHFLRTATMLLTSLSIPSVHTECRKEIIPNLYFVMEQSVKVFAGLGLSLLGVKTCGDFMFSGHTIIVTMFNCVLREYFPKRCLLVDIYAWMMNIFCMIFILAAQKHYTIDVFFGFIITVYYFNHYHIIVNTVSLRKRANREWRTWVPFMAFIEDKVDRKVKNEFHWPFSRCIIDYLQVPCGKMCDFLGTITLECFTAYDST